MENKTQYLLDTNVYIWWMLGSNRLDQDISVLLENPENSIFISTMSVWEIILKKKKGKLQVPVKWRESLQESGYRILSISLDHIFAVESLPFYHNDPFDRLLIAQAQKEHLKLITSDKKIWQYEVDVLKA